jgi:hypothetical protein
MAKGLRASVKKSNRTKLRARVFRPVEDARLERLHAKMLEVIEQPKPEPPKTKEMEVDAEGAGASKEDSYPKGSCFLTAQIPACLTDTDTDPTCALTTDDDFLARPFYHYLGLSSDILGFTPSGGLAFAFDLLPPSCTSSRSDHGLTASS